jgi:small subunit ribosomal protein S8
MLTRIRNANIAMHDSAVMPSSKVKEALAKILLQRATSRDGTRRTTRRGPGASSRSPSSTRPTAGARSPGSSGCRSPARVYTAATEVPRVLGGMGIAVLSTNQGLLTDRQARERRVGGEILCQVW